MRLADRLFGRRNADAMTVRLVGQNKDRHITAFDTLTLFVNTKKLGPFAEPSLLGKIKA